MGIGQGVLGQLDPGHEIADPTIPARLHAAPAGARPGGPPRRERLATDLADREAARLARGGMLGSVGSQSATIASFDPTSGSYRWALVGR